MNEPETRMEPTRAREHLANERTLLAWVRTSIALYGLGFVITQFALFLRQASATPLLNETVSTAIAEALVATGMLVMVLSTIRFFRARAQIERGAFEPEIFAEAVLVALALCGGAALFAYLLFNG